MNVGEPRPRVAELMFRLYDRPLHPELFKVLAERRVRCRDFTLVVRITPSGHVISWSADQGFLTEVAAPARADLPTHRPLFARRIRGAQSEAVTFAPGLHYQSTFQVETMTDEVFGHVHDEILQDGLRRGLLHNLRPSNRLDLAPLSFVTTESWDDNLVIHAFHTFPDERTVVKTQSLLERR